MTVMEDSWHGSGRALFGSNFGSTIKDMRTFLPQLLLLLLVTSAKAQQRNVVTKQLGRFGPVEISFREETDNGRVSRSIYGNYQAAGSDDITDIGGFYLNDSVSAVTFCQQLLQAIESLEKAKGTTVWTGRSYRIDAVRSDRKVRISDVGRNASAYVNLNILQAQKLSEVLERSVYLLRPEQ